MANLETKTLTEVLGKIEETKSAEILANEYANFQEMFYEFDLLEDFDINIFVRFAEVGGSSTLGEILTAIEILKTQSVFYEIFAEQMLANYKL